MARSVRAGGLSVPTKLFYGFGSVAFGVKDQGFSFLLLIFYNQVVGLPSATVGLAIMVALIVDSLLDPIMGQLSDNTRSKWGRRHPYMYAAALPVGLSYLLLWNPPAWSHEALFFYLIAVAILIRSFITMYEIPSAALAAELTTDYDERTKVLSYRYLFGWVGGITMTLLALQVFLRADDGHKVGQLNPAGYSHYALAASAIMIGAILTSAIGTHRHIPRLRTPPARKLTIPQLAREMAGTLSHGSFLVLMGAAFCNAMAQGLVLSINLYFNTFFWELESGQIAFLAMGNFGSAALAFAFAAPISKRLGKRATAIIMKVLAFSIGVTPILLRLSGAAPANDDPALMALLFAQNMISTAFSITASIMVSSMIADVVESSELRTGRRSEGLFFAAAAFVNKSVSGIGIFSSGVLLALIAFPEGARPGEVSGEIIRNLGLVYIPTLGAIYGAAILFVSLYRISRAEHEESLRKLAAAAEREDTPDAVGPQAG